MSQTQEKKPRKENTFWRDGIISQRHRKYGIPMVDLDLVLVEFNHAVPLALLEFKSEAAEPQPINHPSIEALRKLGDMANIMFFGVRYARNFSKFIVVALNEKASDHIKAMHDLDADGPGKAKMEMNELEYVKFLYSICNTNPPTHILNMFSQQEIFQD